MDNENRWEYDYSSLYNTSASPNQGDSGYQNVGSSGNNAANQYNDFGTSYSGSSNSYGRKPLIQDGNGGNGGNPPPQSSYTEPSKPSRRGTVGKVIRSVLALAVAAAVGFTGGLIGGQLSTGSKMVIQAADRTEITNSALATSTSTGGSDLTLAQVSALVSPSVVVITTEQVVYSQWSWYGQSQVQSGAGSGVIISEDGYILTCAHVIDGASTIKVTIDDEDYTASVVGSDSTSDIAVIKIDAEGLTPAVVGDSDALVVGEEVVAVGNPLGELGGTVTNGIVSALNRDVSIQGTNSILNMSLIQTNASVSPGNSGGGLFNMAGELIGIVNAKSSDSDAEGLGFAIPINTAISVAQDLLENGFVTGRPYLGITYLAVTDATTAQQLGVSAYGIYIMAVVDGSPASRAGLAAGDRIVSIDNSEIAAQEDLGTIIQSHSAGDTVSITVARGGQMLTMSVTLGEQTSAQ